LLGGIPLNKKFISENYPPPVLIGHVSAHWYRRSWRSSSICHFGWETQRLNPLSFRIVLAKVFEIPTFVSSISWVKLRSQGSIISSPRVFSVSGVISLGRLVEEDPTDLLFSSTSQKESCRWAYAFLSECWRDFFY